MVVRRLLGLAPVAGPPGCRLIARQYLSPPAAAPNPHRVMAAMKIVSI